MAALLCSAAIVGFLCDFVMINLYIASVRRFFSLFNVDKLELGHKCVIYIFYYTLVPFFLCRMVLEMFSIIAWNYIVYGPLDKESCWYYTIHWIQNYTKLLGYISDLIPYYAAIIILYILSVFGAKTSIMHSEMSSSRD